MKIARVSAVKHKITLNETNIVTEFEKEECSLDKDLKDIEGLIITSYLKTKPSSPSTISIRKIMLLQFFPIYRMVREYLDIKM